ncbi:MAG TPA: PCP reductase family protein [Nitrospiria bacterium]|nr:PCP reductase family protein [Nitrospiria bacterium]
MSNNDIQIRWTEDALKSVEKAPVFLRGMVKKLAEKKAREMGLLKITAEQLAQWKNESMGALGGEKGLQEAADQMAKGHLPWTLAARERLATVPIFMRDMVRQIAEEIAQERGHLEVNVELLQKVEALGEFEDHKTDAEMSWTDGAKALLMKKIESAPAVATDFVFQMLKNDAEDLAHSKGLTEMTEENLKTIWEAPLEEVKWSGEAWRRLQTSPDFVRSGIKKAAERRARKEGVGEISSEMLTRYRNQAMMKAVMRIRKLGFNELTFDAFDAAKQKVKRLQGNEQADKRLDEIRDFMTKRPEKPGEVLGEELMTRFRKYLKGDQDLKLDE